MAGPPINAENIVASPSPNKVLLRPGSSMKFLPTTCPFVVISPTCSISTANTTGAITSIDAISNLGSVKLGTAIYADLDIMLVSTILKINESIYPDDTAISIANCFEKPFPNKLMDNAIAKVIPAIIKFSLAIPIAVGTRFNPIVIIIGPTTWAGRSLFIVVTPIFLTRNEIIT